MSTTSSEDGRGTATWDQLYETLAAQPRRMIIFSLMKEPGERWLPLPEAAQSFDQPKSSENFCIQLRHHHLPKLADAGYVRWESNPFCVRRGPHFEEPALVIAKMTENGTEYPRRLREECVVIGEVGKSDSN